MKAEVFVIESVDFGDEKENRREGQILTGILNLAGKNTAYFYIRTRKELEAVLAKFAESNFRYLHISCHGGTNKIYMTLDDLPLDEFGRIVKPYLKNRRLFLSACEATNKKLAGAVIPHSGCYSLIGPKGDIDFGDAAMVWASFYHIMFQRNSDAMKGSDIRPVLTRICSTFGVSMRYFRSSKKSPFYTSKVFHPPHKT